MAKYRCTVCNWVYDDAKEKVKFSDLPKEWVCPVCGAPKSAFVLLVEGYGEPKRFDPDTKTHHHFRCTKCSNIIDIHHKSFDNIRIPQDIQKRFTVLNKKVVLEGVCEKCGKKRR